MSEPPKRINPFSDKPIPHEILQLQQQIQQQQQAPQQQQQQPPQPPQPPQQPPLLMTPPRMDLGRRNSNPGPGFNPRFMYAGGPELRNETEPFIINNSPHAVPQFIQQQPMNFRGAAPFRNNSPYFRNQKGGNGNGGNGAGPPGNMRGSFRPNFRGRNW